METALELSDTLLGGLSGDLLGHILEFSEVGFNGTRIDYKKGSPVCRAMYNDTWWLDYLWDVGIVVGSDDGDLEEETWIEWCQYRLIIGPPRPRGHREICGYNEDYILNDEEEFNRHYYPWMKTWPEPGDHSWCTARGDTGVPDWANLDYVLRKKIFMAETVEGDGIRSKVTVKQLKAELRSRGLKVTGLKHQLIRRLMVHLSVP
jgi:hypothetical protein